MPGGSGENIDERRALQAELHALMDRRTVMEREMDGLVNRLNGPEFKAIGMTTSLVDGEGFPRADIDVHAVRICRNRLAVLRTDYKALMLQIETKLHDLHAKGGPVKSATPAPAPGRASSGTAPTAAVPWPLSQPNAGAAGTTNAAVPAAAVPAGPPVELVPIARVNTVAEGGPAASAGLMAGDLLLRIGTLDATNMRTLADMSPIVQSSVGRAVSVVVRRTGGDGAVPEQLSLSLTPRQWSGQGLLGCHIVPL